jgi:hypothetical protein
MVRSPFPAIAGAGHSLSQNLAGVDANRIQVEAALQAVRCILFFGHGSKDALAGANGTPLVNAANIGLARGTVFVAIACDAAAELGPKSIRAGIEAFLGFDDRFILLTGDPDFQFQPAATSGIRRLLGGGTTEDALDEMRRSFGHVVEFYANRGGPNSTFGRLVAFWTRHHLKLCGDLSARI